VNALIDCTDVETIELHMRKLACHFHDPSITRSWLTKCSVELGYNTDASTNLPSSGPSTYIQNTLPSLRVQRQDLAYWADEIRPEQGAEKEMKFVESLLMVPISRVSNRISTKWATIRCVTHLLLGGINWQWVWQATMRMEESTIAFLKVAFEFG
jgi:hypothetical protein